MGENRKKDKLWNAVISLWIAKAQTQGKVSQCSEYSCPNNPCRKHYGHQEPAVRKQMFHPLQPFGNLRHCEQHMY